MTTAVRERPILFSGPMIRAILDGRKTQTRRVIKPQPVGAWAAPGKTACPYGVPGDRLWVRETWRPSQTGEGSRCPAWYAADGADGEHVRWKPSIFMPRWASRITLEITRIDVRRVQDVGTDALAEGVELTEFWTPKEVEGRPFEEKWWDDFYFWSHYPLVAFRKLWDSINANRGFGWDVNPWVWVVEFRRVTDSGKGE